MQVHGGGNGRARAALGLGSEKVKRGKKEQRHQRVNLIRVVSAVYRSPTNPITLSLGPKVRMRQAAPDRCALAVFRRFVDSRTGRSFLTLPTTRTFYTPAGIHVTL